MRVKSKQEMGCMHVKCKRKISRKGAGKVANFFRLSIFRLLKDNPAIRNRLSV